MLVGMATRTSSPGEGTAGPTSGDDPDAMETESEAESEVEPAAICTARTTRP